jgi:hypothetical protein
MLFAQLLGVPTKIFPKKIPFAQLLGVPPKIFPKKIGKTGRSTQIAKVPIYWVGAVEGECMAGLAGKDKNDPGVQAIMAELPIEARKSAPRKGKKTKRIQYRIRPEDQKKRFRPTEAQRKQVAFFIGMGLTINEIESLTGFSDSTLYKHFRKELDSGRAEQNFKVAENLYNIATSPTAKGNVPAAMFWLRTRAGWKDKQHVELTGPDGQPLTKAVSEVVDPRSLSIEQRELLKEVIMQAVAAGEQRAADNMRPAQMIEYDSHDD